MGLTISTVAGADFVAGNKKVKVRKVTFDSSYPTGGESLVASDVGLKKIEQVIPHGAFTANEGGTTGVIVRYDYTNKKLQAFWARATDGNAQSATVFPEVTDTTSLSTQTGRLTIIGY